MKPDHNEIKTDRYNKCIYITKIREYKCEKEKVYGDFRRIHTGTCIFSDQYSIVRKKGK